MCQVIVLPQFNHQPLEPVLLLYAAWESSVSAGEGAFLFNPVPQQEALQFSPRRLLQSRSQTGKLHLYPTLEQEIVFPPSHPTPFS